MKKRFILLILLALAMGLILTSCNSSKGPVKIGVSFGVGKATRWDQEKTFMEDRAKELGVEIEVRLNRTDEPKNQQEDCFEMIDNGIDALIITPRDVNKTDEILKYAKEHKVPVISYARASTSSEVDLFVGYDSRRIGQRMGQYLAETVFEGDYILLKGDENDSNATLLYDGAMRYIEPIKPNINIILDASVPNWSAETAEQMVYDAIEKNGNKIDAILAPNDKLAEACAAAIKKLGITNHVVITGMDAELAAVQRIVDGTQDATIYMDLKELACTSIDAAVSLAKKEKPMTNATFDNSGDTPIDANLITGQLIVKENIDKILIESGYFTKEEVYGK